MLKKSIVILTLCAVLVMLVAAFPIAAADPTYTVSNEYLTSQYYANLKSVELTGDQRTDVVLVALSQLGYHEGNSDADMGGASSGTKNFVEYNRTYGKIDNGEGNGTSYGYAWCCAFSTWCVRQAGVPASVVTTEVSCHRLINWLKGSTVSTYKEASTGYIPKTGDLIFFKNSTTTLLASHVGIVRYVSGSKVYTIEGNTSTYNVAVREYDLTASNIVGYGVPAYVENPSKAIDFSKNNPGTYCVTVSSGSNLNVRNEPSASSATTQIIGSLKSGDKVTVTELSGTWGKINYNGKTGWISLAYAQYVPSAPYTIYYNANGGTGVIASQPKKDGIDTVLTNTMPKKSGYSFAGWATTKDAQHAEYAPGSKFSTNADTVLYAVWSMGTYSVTFFNGTVQLQRGEYAHNALVSYLSPTPTKDADKTYTYDFAGWDINDDGKVDVKPGESIKADKDIVAKAVFSPVYINYKVSFVGVAGTISEKADYHYGDKLVVPTVPTFNDGMYAYTFNGWDTAPAETVTANAVYTATYTQSLARYKIKFVDGDGKVMSEEEYGYGALVSVPAQTPTKTADETYTYTFREWDSPLKMVTGDTTYTATFDRTYIEYKITFIGDGGVALDTRTYHYGDMPTAPVTEPVKAADETYKYSFAGWDHEIVKVTADATYTAAFDATAIIYKVTFFNDDGIVYKIDEYYYGDTIKLPEPPKKSGSNSEAYAFAGWTPEVSTVSGNMSFTATYKAIETETTTAPVEQSSGCGSAISAAFILALIPAAFVFKKKEN